MKRIADRKRNASLEKINDYRMMLQIVTAPHTEKGAGVTQLMRNFDEMEKDIKSPERVRSRIKSRDKLEELLLAQINSFPREG